MVISKPKTKLEKIAETKALKPTRRSVIAAAAALPFLTGSCSVMGEADHATGEMKREEVSWHKALRQKTLSSLDDIGDYAQNRWRQFSENMGFNTPRHIAAYRGYATRDKVYVQGRLLANKRYDGPDDDDGWWENLKATYERWESDEIPDAKIHLQYLDQTLTVKTDEEGYYKAEFPRSKKFPKSDVVTATHELEDRVLSSSHPISLLHPQAEYIVISDVDDTVIHTGITNLLLSAQLTFLNNAKTRKPLAGVGSLYQSFARGFKEHPVNPIIYLSNSAWNMYDLLRDFINLNDLPKGPLLLRDIGLGANSSHHKMETLEKLMARYEGLPVVLVGDSGQHDAKYYSKLAEKYPERVKAIYIRDVDPREDSEYDTKVDHIIKQNAQIGVPFVRVQSSDQVAQHAIKIGLLPKSDMRSINEDTEKDKSRETVSEKAGMGG